MPAFPTHLKWEDINKKLADPKFNKPGLTPILLGGEVFQHFMQTGVETRDNMLLQKTRFGWIVSGRPAPDVGKYVSTHVHLSEVKLQQQYAAQSIETFRETFNHATVSEIGDPTAKVDSNNAYSVANDAIMNNQLLEFWDLPINQEDISIDVEDYCEKLFRESHYRTEDGRYGCPIPWKLDGPVIGSSFRSSLRRYLAQEYRLVKNQIHLKLRNEFFQDYLDRGHMTLVLLGKQKDESNKVHYFVTESIFREDSLTTALRMVFDGAAPTSNKTTLNQTIHAGPALQTKINDILHTVFCQK